MFLKTGSLWLFFREVDHDRTGEASATEFASAAYRVQINTWPQLDDAGIARIMGILNAAANKWHRASGNWYKVFQASDEDESGSMSFDEMVSLFRKGYPGLSVPPSKISNDELRGFWRALDSTCMGRVTVFDFLVFMRNHGAELSMHKSSLEFRKKDVIEEDLGQPADRDDDDLRRIAQTLDRILSGYWNRRGIYVRAMEKWQRLLAEADVSNVRRFTFREIEYALCDKFKAARNTAFDGPMSAAAKQKQLAQYLQDGFVVWEWGMGVSHDDLYALWCKIDTDRFGQVTPEQWTVGIYRLWLDTWPDCSERVLIKAVGQISDAAMKYVGKAKNWFKVFNIVSHGSCSIDYDEFFKVVRRPLPCLAIPTSSLSNVELQGLWKAMDADRSGAVSENEFMVFMRRLEGRHARPGAARGSIVFKANAMMELSRKARERRNLSPAQQEVVKARLQNLTAEDFENVYATWEIPWSGLVSDWEWHRVIRELLEISEQELDDECVHSIWSKLDREKHGRVPVEAVIELGWCA